MSIVSLLPKEELAEMAETLVSLTSFKRRMTPEAETVGGPIDVAVISKGDGLVWVKRKHYFDRNLNLRYFERDRRLYTTSMSRRGQQWPLDTLTNLARGSNKRSVPRAGPITHETRRQRRTAVAVADELFTKAVRSIEAKQRQR